MMRFVLLLAGIFCYIQLLSQEVLHFSKQINLVPEGIAIDPQRGTIYISSIAKKKIIRLSIDGSSEDFIASGHDGFLEGLGMKVDTSKSCLWALSNIRNGNQFTSQIHGFDLESGKTIHHFILTDTVPRLFNDLVIHKSGELFITDTYSSAIYRYEPSYNKLNVFVSDTSKLRWPNGIEFLDATHLVVATYGTGILRVDVNTKEVRQISGYKDTALAFGLDGLVMHGNQLNGVYNAGNGGYSTNAVIQYTLDTNKEHFSAEKLIDRGNPAFADPTTAAKFGDKLYVIANSHLDQFNKNKETVSGIEEDLKPLALIIYKL